METRKHQFSTRADTSFGDPAVSFPTAFVMKDSGLDLGDGPVPEDGDRRRPSFPPAGSKPIADELRSMLPFGSPTRDGQHEKTRRNTGGNARSQVDLLHGGTGAPVDRQGRWRDQSPPRLRGHLDGPASATIPFLAALREARLNGFAEALAVVPHHRNAARRRWVSDPPPLSLSDASNEGKPAYPRYNRGLARDVAPSIPNKPRAPVDCAGGGVAPLPPVAAQPDG